MQWNENGLNEDKEGLSEASSFNFNPIILQEVGVVDDNYKKFVCLNVKSH